MLKFYPDFNINVEHYPSLNRNFLSYEEAKEIIYSQIDTLRGINSSCHHSIPIVIPMNTRR
jgi:hypothetical protein